MTDPFAPVGGARGLYNSRRRRRDGHLATASDRWRPRLGRVPETIWDETDLEKLDLRWVRTLASPSWLDDLDARGVRVYR